MFSREQLLPKPLQTDSGQVAKFGEISLWLWADLPATTAAPSAAGWSPEIEGAGGGSDTSLLAGAEIQRVVSQFIEDLDSLPHLTETRSPARRPVIGACCLSTGLSRNPD